QAHSSRLANPFQLARQTRPDRRKLPGCARESPEPPRAWEPSAWWVGTRAEAPARRFDSPWLAKPGSGRRRPAGPAAGLLDQDRAERPARSGAVAFSPDAGWRRR